MFTQAAPAGSRLLPVSNATRTGHARVGDPRPNGRARAGDQRQHRLGARVRVRNPAGYGRRPGTIERLRAPGGAYATSGVTLGGRSFGRDHGPVYYRRR